MTMRRLFGPCGGAANKDVPAVADVDESLGNGKDQGACAARKKAKGQGMGRTKEDGMPKKSSDKMKGDGQTLDGFNPRAGLRSRCHKCDSEYHVASERPRSGVL